MLLYLQDRTSSMEAQRLRPWTRILFPGCGVRVWSTCRDQLSLESRTWTLSSEVLMWTHLDLGSFVGPGCVQVGLFPPGPLAAPRETSCLDLGLLGRRPQLRHVGVGALASRTRTRTRTGPLVRLEHVLPGAVAVRS